MREATRQNEWEHATPLLPKKGMKRLKLDALRRGERLISNYGWLRTKKRPGGAKAGAK